MKRVANEFSQAVFNLPWLVAQEEGLFAQKVSRWSFCGRASGITRAPEARSPASRPLLAACPVRRTGGRRLQCL